MEREKIEIVKHALRLGAFLERTGSRLLKTYGLTHQQFIVLKWIEEKGPISQKDICSDLLFEKSNISKIVKKLQEGKLITMSFSAEDSRVSIVEITTHGKSIINKCMKMLNTWNRRWLADLTAAEVKQTLQCFRRLSMSHE